ncbi:MAG: PepSY-associated TM helix domain-containing protein, partial [Pseudomonas sp.]
RSWLDGHNAIGVLVLPFHLMISYSSLVIFMSMVMPASIIASYGDDTRGFFNDVFAAPEPLKAAGVAAPLLALPRLYEKVLAQSPGSRLGWIEVQNPGDQNARVKFSPHAGDRIAHQRGGGWTFDGVTGTAQGDNRIEATPMLIAGAMYGLHMGVFAGTGLRWLYFVFGLAGTAVIGTGLVMWLGKRQLKHAKRATQPFELRLVEVLNIASMSGLLLGVAAFFWANRLLPPGLQGRADWEINCFFLLWALSLLHAMLRPGRRAWAEQLGLAALLWAGLPLLNQLTTGQGLVHSIQVGDWAMAGFDLTAMGCGLFLAWCAGKMWRPPVVAKRAAKEKKAASTHLIESEVS